MENIHFNIVVEDVLTEAVLRKMLHQAGRYEVAVCCGRQGNDFIRKNITKYNDSAKGMPWIVITDLDTHPCPSELIGKWLPCAKNPNLLFRVAVHEVESWILAHRKAFSRFLGVREALLPMRPDDVLDPKKEVFRLASKSKNRSLKEALLPRLGSKVGPDYNGQMGSFVQREWSVVEAARNSPSLSKALSAVSSFVWEK